MQRIYMFFLFLSISYSVSAQNFCGEILDQKDSLVYGSTIFIKEINQGIVCNDGKFCTKIPPGKYTIEYKCIGYQTYIEKNVKIDETAGAKRQIVLKERAYDLSEVTVSNNQEDFAYTVMRQAIKKAPFYANKVKSYTADAYVKGTMELNKVSNLVNKLAKGDDGLKLSDYKGNLFLQESYSIIKYTAPNRYEQTVKAFSSTIPDNFNSKDVMRIMEDNLYLPMFAEMISPLNPKAFSYYRFKYEGYTDEAKDIVYKIKVTPKLRDPELMSGYIYIAEGDWNIRNANFVNTSYGIKQDFVISYDQVSEGVYLPSTYNNIVSVNLFGVEGYFNYNSSIKYIEIKTKIDKDVKVNLSKKKKRDFEIKRSNDLYKVQSDTLSTKRDSTYWQNVRISPLNKEEVKSYRKKDSIQTQINVLRKKKTDSKFGLTDLLLGGQIGGDSTNVTFKFGGLINAVSDYNFVDGLSIGEKIGLAFKLDSIHTLKIKSSAHYTTARKRIVTNSSISMNYAPMRLGYVELSGGSISTDYNPDGIARFDNAWSSLLFGNNKDMLYRKDYLKLGNNIDLANGLNLGTVIEFAKRYNLKNNTTYSFWGRRSDAKDNLEDSNNSLTKFSVSLKYSPYAYYSIKNGKKTYEEITSPTFSLNYSQGLSLFKNSSAFQMIDLNVSQKIKTNMFSTLSYSIEAGTFLGNTDNIGFADYKHFNTSNILLGGKIPYNTFMLLDNYDASTNRQWVIGSLNYESKYIFLKRLPFMQGKLVNEALHFKTLYTPNKKYYTELGYSLNLFQTLDVGFYMSLDQFRAKDFGFRLSYNFLNF